MCLQQTKYPKTIKQLKYLTVNPGAVTQIILRRLQFKSNEIYSIPKITLVLYVTPCSLAGHVNYSLSIASPRIAVPILCLPISVPFLNVYITLLS
jgi:hypothetical protein